MVGVNFLAITWGITTDSTRAEEEGSAPQGLKETESPLESELLMLSMQATLLLSETNPSLNWLGTTILTIPYRIVRHSLGEVNDAKMVVTSLLFV